MSQDARGEGAQAMETVRADSGTRRDSESNTKDGSGMNFLPLALVWHLSNPNVVVEQSGWECSFWLHPTRPAIQRCVKAGPRMLPHQPFNKLWIIPHSVE